jgi:outer membrane protein
MQKNTQAEQKFRLEWWLMGGIAILTIYAAVVAATLTFFRSPKIGYVDSATLLQQYKGAAAAKGKLDKELEEWQKNVKTLETELAQLNQEILKASEKWDRQQRSRKKEEFEKKQTDYARYSRAVNEKAVKREQELMQPVFDELNAHIKDFGHQHGYKIIFGTVAGGNILYGQEATDITGEFLAYANSK